jgi:hypothetical protein
MRRYLILLLLVGVMLVAGCSSPNPSTPAERDAQVLTSGHFPTNGFQYNAFFFTDPIIPSPKMVPLEVPLKAFGLSGDDVLAILSGGSLVNAACPFDVDVPEWDEWLLKTTLDVDVPEWDEWLTDVDVPEWDEWLLNQGPLDVDVPEWDEWLTRFTLMEQHRSADWMDWAVYGPYQILDVDVPEWDEWLTGLTIGEMAYSYDEWLMAGATEH